jgi:hypothetical protein
MVSFGVLRPEGSRPLIRQANNVKYVTNFSCELPGQRLNISSCVCHDKGSF